jgi:CheY-like chemotaxis protein
MSKPTTILLVDDEIEIISVMSDMLQFLGCEVLTATNGFSALQQFQQYNQDIDAVMLDLSMPDASGIEIFQNIRAIRSDVPVFIISGYTEEDSADRFIDPPDGFLQKPIHLQQMRELLNNINCPNILA